MTHDALPFPPSRAEVEARYAVRLLADARAGVPGLAHREGFVPWWGVAHVLAAEVGEPQGVRTVVFDMVLEGAGGGAWQVLRFDAEPGEAAVAVARILTRALSPERLTSSIKSLAVDGLAFEWHADLCAFEEAALEILAAR